MTSPRARGDHLRNAQEAVDRFAAVRSRQDRGPGMVGARAVAKCRREERCVRLGRLGGRTGGLALSTADRRADSRNLRVSQQRPRRANGPRPSWAQAPRCRNSTIPSWRRWHASTLGCGRGRRGRCSRASSRRSSGRASAWRQRRRPRGGCANASTRAFTSTAGSSGRRH